MRLVSNDEVLASEVEIADSHLARAKGLMFRRTIPDDYALVFRFDRPAPRSVHMLFVPFPLAVVWVIDGRVDRVARLRPWFGLASHRADTLIELPAGRVEDVEAGDEIRLEGPT